MSNSTSGLGGKIFGALLLSVVVGFFWACFETGRNPLDLLKLFKSEDTAEPADSRKPPPPAPRPDAPRPAPPAPRPDVPKPPPPPPAPPAPAPATVRTLSATEVNALFVTLDDHLRRGKLFEAHNLVQNTSKPQLPEDALARFAEYEARVGKYYALVRETTRGILIDMPRIASVILKSGGKLVVKVLSDTSTAVLFESITGIRGRIAKADIESMEDLKPAYAGAEIKLELVKKAGYLGLEVVDASGQPLAYKDRPNRPRATGSQIFFDLADFCARNGANDKLVPLFDEALRRDPDLLVTVHEAKADRLVNVLLYYLSINSGMDAKDTLEQLKKSYGDTRAYRDRVGSDPEIAQMTDLVFARRSAPPPASAPLAKADAAKPPVPPPAGQPVPPPPPPSDPVAKTPEPREIERQPAVAGAEPNTLALPDGTSAKVRDLVARGDKYFTEAMNHLQSSDPNLNPDGWTTENKKALDAFMKANQEGYILAQDEYGKGGVPQSLLDRVRETTMRSSLCRKRSVSTRK
jgi:hypothetical protein